MKSGWSVARDVDDPDMFAAKGNAGSIVGALVPNENRHIHPNPFVRCHQPCPALTGELEGVGSWCAGRQPWAARSVSTF